MFQTTNQICKNADFLDEISSEIGVFSRLNGYHSMDLWDPLGRFSGDELYLDFATKKAQQKIDLAIPQSWRLSHWIKMPKIKSSATRRIQ